MVTTTTELERLQLGFSVAFTPDFFTTSVDPDMARDVMIAKVRADLLSKMTESWVDVHDCPVAIAVPANLWNQFKAWCNDSFNTQLNIKTKPQETPGWYHITYKVYNVCPHVKIQDQQVHLRFLTDGPDNREE